MAWAHGHKSDWDFLASEAGDPAWNYDSALNIYRRIEDWHGPPDPKRRGTGGPVFVQPAPDPNPIAPAMVEEARSVGIPTFENHNGRMMEGDGGAAILEVQVRDGQRLSVFRSYIFPRMDQPNLTVLTHALVTRVTFVGKRATGVEVTCEGKIHRIGAKFEVVLSLGAMHTPKALMLSGIGDQAELRRLGIPLVQHLPGVGQNFQDHLLLLSCVWEHQQPEPVAQREQSVLLWKSNSSLDTPDMLCVHGEGVFVSAETAKFNPPAN